MERNSGFTEESLLPTRGAFPKNNYGRKFRHYQ